MPELKPFKVGPRQFHELVIMPQFGDVVDQAGNIIPSAEEGDWQIMDDVVHTRPILELFGGQNILKRRDATCKLIYSPVARLGARYIKTERLYAATEDCQEEFYQGCFEDFAQENFDVFGAQVMPIMEKGVATDLFTNKYFGDLDRASDATGQWSWNKFDGIFTHYAKYIADGVIPAGQVFTIPAGDLTPQQCRDALNTAYIKQDGVLKLSAKGIKAFYVSDSIAEGYYDWLQATGVTTAMDLMTGKPKLFYKGIEVRVKEWDGVLAAINGGTAAHAVILTVKGNFLYGTDSKYGGGARRNEALRVWWSDDDNVWRRQMHMKAGTEIAAPTMSVIGLTEL